MNFVAAITNVFNLIYFLIILRVFLSWIPTLDWRKQPFKTLQDIVDPCFALFRKYIPPVANFDFSPIILLIVLQIIQHILLELVAGSLR